MGEAFLQLQIIFHRHLCADAAMRGDFTVFCLEYRKQAGLNRQPRQLDGVRWVCAPTQRARYVDVDVTRPVDAHRLGHFRLQIAQIGH